MQAAHSLFSPRQIATLDAAAVEAGVSLQTLVYLAGTQAAQAIHERWPDRAMVVLCGPGNNGADGWIAAQHLRGLGHRVRVCIPSAIEKANAQVQWAASLWPDRIQASDVCDVQPDEVVVDALFGTGLNAALSTVVQQWIIQIRAAGVPVCALDIPSGVSGATGAVIGEAFQADLTLAFLSAKPGHYLLPGREHTGEVQVIALPFPFALWQRLASDTAFRDSLGTVAQLNSPALWAAQLPNPTMAGHKYHRGHACVIGGDLLTGAARLAAMAAQRIGAGLTSVLASSSAWQVYAAALPSSIMVQKIENDAWQHVCEDQRENAWVMGPGLGVTAHSQQLVLQALKAQKSLVLDADAITAFTGQAELLAQHITSPCVLTPHAGEFARLFARSADKLQDVVQAAASLGAVVVFKGADTVIAAPDGRVTINANAPAILATGGSGDVLAGMIGGLLAQGLPAFEAACAAVWLHGEAAQQYGVGLVPEDIIAALPKVQHLCR